jgi:hypothetical protein
MSEGKKKPEKDSSAGIRLVLQLTPREVALLDRKQKETGTHRKDLIHQAIEETYKYDWSGLLLGSVLVLVIDYALGRSIWLDPSWPWWVLKASGLLLSLIATWHLFTKALGEFVFLHLSSSTEPLSSPGGTSALPLAAQAAPAPLKLPENASSPVNLLESGPKPGLNPLTVNRAQPTGLAALPQEKTGAQAAGQKQGGPLVFPENGQAEPLSESRWEREVFEKLKGIRCPNCDGIDLGIILYGHLPRGDGRLNHLMRMRLLVPGGTLLHEEDLYCNDCESYWVSGFKLGEFGRGKTPFKRG